jgi:hypothetical protein
MAQSPYTYGAGFRTNKPVKGAKYKTYKKDVDVGVGQSLGYTPGYGYYVRNIPSLAEKRSRAMPQVPSRPTPRPSRPSPPVAMPQPGRPPGTPLAPVRPTPAPSRSIRPARPGDEPGPKTGDVVQTPWGPGVLYNQDVLKRLRRRRLGGRAI